MTHFLNKFPFFTLSILSIDNYLVSFDFSSPSESAFSALNRPSGYLKGNPNQLGEMVSEMCTICLIQREKFLLSVEQIQG